MTTDLGVECMVGLCLAAAIWWIARRRRTHTEGPKTRLDPLGLAELEPLSATDDNTLKKDDLVVEDNSAQRNASGMLGKDLPLSPSPQQQEHKRADEVDNESDQESEEDKEEDESWDVEDEDDAAEPDLTDDEDEDEEREEAADEDEEEDEEENDEPRVVNAELDEVPLETLARVEALAAKMGVNMTESFMAMEEFLVLDAPPSPGALPSFETDRMRLEDHAVVPLSDAASDSEDEETDNNDDQPVDETKEEEEQERRASHDDNEQPLEDAAPDAEAAFWAKCENREECNLCHTPFTFLTRRHHCRKCFASVCGGCSANSAPLPEFGGRLERVCDTCWTSLQQQKQVTPAADEETGTTEEVHEHEAS